MVRTQTLPFESAARATRGQLAWVYLNQILDYDERVRKIHTHCRAKWEADHCEVCGELVVDVSKLDPEIQKEIYRPGEDEQKNVVINFPKRGNPVEVSDEDDEEENV